MILLFENDLHPMKNMSLTENVNVKFADAVEIFTISRLLLMEAFLTLFQCLESENNEYQCSIIRICKAETAPTYLLIKENISRHFAQLCD